MANQKAKLEEFVEDNQSLINTLLEAKRIVADYKNGTIEFTAKEGRITAVGNQLKGNGINYDMGSSFDRFVIKTHGIIKTGKEDRFLKLLVKALENEEKKVSVKGFSEIGNKPERLARAYGNLKAMVKGCVECRIKDEVYSLSGRIRKNHDTEALTETLGVLKENGLNIEVKDGKYKAKIDGDRAFRKVERAMERKGVIFLVAGRAAPLHQNYDFVVGTKSLAKEDRVSFDHDKNSMRFKIKKNNSYRDINLEKVLKYLNAGEDVDIKKSQKSNGEVEIYFKEMVNTKALEKTMDKHGVDMGIGAHVYMRYS